jgi:chromosome segregation ATPase
MFNRKTSSPAPKFPTVGEVESELSELAARIQAIPKEAASAAPDTAAALWDELAVRIARKSELEAALPQVKAHEAALEQANQIREMVLDIQASEKLIADNAPRITKLLAQEKELGDQLREVEKERKKYGSQSNGATYRIAELKAILRKQFGYNYDEVSSE